MATLTSAQKSTCFSIRSVTPLAPPTFLVQDPPAGYKSENGLFSSHFNTCTQRVNTSVCSHHQLQGFRPRRLNTPTNGYTLTLFQHSSCVLLKTSSSNCYFIASITDKSIFPMHDMITRVFTPNVNVSFQSHYTIIPCNHLFSLHMGAFIQRWQYPLPVK